MIPINTYQKEVYKNTLISSAKSVLQESKKTSIHILQLSLIITLITLVSVMNANAAPAPVPQPVFVNGISQPVFDDNTIREVYYVISPLDTDSNGVPDLIQVTILRSKDTDRGAKMPVIISPSPYLDSDVQSEKAFENAWFEGRVDTLYDGSGDYTNENFLGSFSNNQRHQNNRYIFSNGNETASPKYLAARGFISAYVSALGTSQSTGCAMIDYTNDGQALKAVVDWLNGRAQAYDKNGKLATAYWTNGKTGAYGYSYNGYMTNALMVTGVPELKFAITGGSVTDFYDYYRTNGAPRDSSANVEVEEPYWTERSDMISLYEYIVSKGLVNRNCKDMRQEIINGQDRITGNKNAWWDGFSVMPYLNGVTTPVTIIHGLRDNNVRTSQSINLYNALKNLGKNVKLILHQGGHSFPSAETTTILRLRYGSQYLYDQETGISSEAKVQIYRENNVKTGYTDFPDPNAVSKTFSLQNSGSMSSNSPASNTIQTLVDDYHFTTYDLLRSILPGASNSRLLFKTPVLNSALRLSGSPLVNIRLAIQPNVVDPNATMVAANLSVALAEFKPDGTFKIITRGWMNPQNRDSNYYKTPIFENQFYSMHFQMEPNDYIFEAGNQIGFMIYSTDNLAHNMPIPGTILKIDLANTNMTMGVIGNAP